MKFHFISRTVSVEWTGWAFKRNDWKKQQQLITKGSILTL